MDWKRILWVATFSTVFFCLPSLAVKLWEGFAALPWQYRRWLVYPLIAWLIMLFVRGRLRRWRGVAEQKGDSLLYIAKKRLVQGELTLDEFRQIRDEIKTE